MREDNIRNILIVDDQPNLQELFSEELRDEGYGIASLSETKSIWEYLKDFKPDLVLLDLFLNGIKGWDLLHQIKRRYPHLPVLIVTAYDSYANDPRLSEAEGYVIKDFFAVDRLKQKIAEALEHKPL